MRTLHLYDRALLPILFPDYILTKEPSELPEKTIFLGRQRVFGADSAFAFKPFLSEAVDVSLPDRAAVMTFVYNRKNVRLTKSIKKYVDKLNDLDFYKELRYFMAASKWKKFSVLDVKVYELFKALTQSKAEFLNLYFKLRKDHVLNELWSSVLTFFQRVAQDTSEDKSLSDYYRTIIETFKRQSRGVKSVVKIIRYGRFDEVLVLNILLKLR